MDSVYQFIVIISNLLLTGRSMEANYSISLGSLPFFSYLHMNFALIHQLVPSFFFPVVSCPPSFPPSHLSAVLPLLTHVQSTFSFVSQSYLPDIFFLLQISAPLHLFCDHSNLFSPP